jgi:tetratricopeptide (TPR) repeat protein
MGEEQTSSAAKRDQGAGGSLVGREREMAQLGEALDGAFAGRGTVMLLAGEPGIGKTSIARALSDEAEGRGAAAVWGIGWAGNAAPAYWPWVQVVRALVRRPGGDDLLAGLRPGAAWLGEIVPELGTEVSGLPRLPRGSAEEGRFHVYDALAELLRRAAGEAPLLVVLDDLQWADEASLLTLAFVARALPDAGVVLLGTYRTTEVPQDELGTSRLADLIGWSRRIELRGLAAADVRRLVEDRSSDGAPDEVVERIHSQTDGNPLFVSELLTLLGDEGRLDDVSAARELPLPEGVREAIGRRLAPLAPDARDALAVGSVIGAQFRVATLSRAAGMSREDLLRLLDPAVEHGLLHAVPASAENYSFSHGLVQATLYDGLAPSRRAELHGAVGEAIEEVYDADELETRLTELAHHFLEAAQDANAEKAVAYARRAGDQAMSQFAYDQAATLFERALAVPGPHPPDERTALLQALGEAQMRAGDTEAARRTLLEAGEVARRHGDADGVARAALACGVWGLTFGVDEELVRLIEEAIQGRPEDGLLARLKGMLAAALYWSGEPERRLRLCDEALALARERDAGIGDRASAETLAYVLGRVLLASWGPDSAQRDVETSEELIERAHRLGDGELELLARNWRISVLFELGDVAAADQEIARVEQMGTELRQPRAMAFLPLHQGMREIASGRYEEAERLMAESAEIGRQVRGSVSELAATAQLLGIRLLQGRLAELEVPLRALSDAHPGMVGLRCVLPVLLVQDGREQEARGELERLTAAGLDGLPLDNTHIVALALLAEVAADLADEERAAAIYGWLEPYAGRWVVSPGAAALWPVERSLGRVAGVMGETDRALAHIAQARHQGERLHALPTVALTALDEAALLAARGEPADAERVAHLAGEARILAEDLGMGGVAREAARLTGDTAEETEAPAAPAAAPADPGAGTLRREGDVWTLSLGDHLVRVKDAKGLRHLALLLSHPGVAFHAVDVIAAGEGRPAAAGGAAPASAAEGDLSIRAAGAGDAGAGLDAEAKADYRRRLEDLREDIEEAEEFNDPERAARAREEYEFIAQELAGAVGLGGRDRPASSDAERARVNATRAIRKTLARVQEHDEALGRLLDRTIRTGTFCAYEPDPERPVEWRVDA